MKTRRWVTWSVWAVVITVCSLLLAVLIVTALFDPNQYKAQVIKWVREKTGRELTIVGDITMNLFTGFGIEVHGAHLANAEGFGPQPMLEVDSVQVRLGVLALLQRRSSLHKITVRGLRLRLQRRADGRTNWEGILAAATRGAQSEPGEALQEAAPAALAALSIGRIKVLNAGISWEDLRSQRHVDLKRVSIRSSRYRPGHDVELKVGMDFESRHPRTR
ncbi:MAG: AsmA family protein, partial [Alphaproteobacteria bacterium]